MRPDLAVLMTEFQGQGMLAFLQADLLHRQKTVEIQHEPLQGMNDVGMHRHLAGDGLAVRKDRDL